jgi:hypothetical protein
MEQSKAMEYESRKASSDVLKPRNIYIYIYFFTVMVISLILLTKDYLFYAPVFLSLIYTTFFEVRH